MIYALQNLLTLLSTILLAVILYGLWQTARMLQQVQPQTCNSPRLCTQPVHWVPTRRVAILTRRLQSKGYLVLNLGSTNGATVLMIREA